MAEADTDEALQWYEQQKPGLGRSSWTKSAEPFAYWKNTRNGVPFTTLAFVAYSPVVFLTSFSTALKAHG